ncbi:MAG: metal ABC transporter ATP-binding protein [Sporichthyaceae bacterium]
MTQALLVEGLAVRYGQRVALRDVAVRAGWGELIAVVGPNGAGKSTLFKSLSGLVPYEGSVSVSGETCHCGRSPATAYLPQRTDVDLAFPISVGSLVLTGRRRFLPPWRRPRCADRAAVADALDAVDLAERAGDPIGSLSGGQLQRAFVARALAAQARVLLLDEAFAGVDGRSVEELMALFARLTAEGRTILVATHDLALTRRHFSRCLAVNGTIVADGPPADVLTLESLEITFGAGLPVPA